MYGRRRISGLNINNVPVLFSRGDRSVTTLPLMGMTAFGVGGGDSSDRRRHENEGTAVILAHSCTQRRKDNIDPEDEPWNSCASWGMTTLRYAALWSRV